MNSPANPPPRWLAPVIWVLILSTLVLSVPMAVFGANTLLADRRIQTRGPTAEAPDLTLPEPQHRVNRPKHTYRLQGDGDQTRSLEISRDTWAGLSVGQTITLQIDPDNPDNHQFDRDRQVRTAWTMALGGVVLGALSLGLLIWALRGGLSGGAARGRQG